MILIDAVYITTGGGKVLLDLLVEKIEKDESTKKIYLLIDIRNKYLYKERKHNKIKVCFLKNSELSRLLFYLRHKNLFSKVICFANIPPPIRLKCKVSTFFQNVLLLDNNLWSNFSLKIKFLFYLKRLLIISRKNKCDDWIVQTNHVDKLLRKTLKNKNLTIFIFPCFDNKNFSIKEKEKISAFFYPAFNVPHKNHKLLIEAWRNLFIKGLITNELHVTIQNDKSNDLYTQLSTYQQEGVPIINHKYISKSEVNSLYMKCKFVIHPSVAESFGLVLIEALKNNCVLLAPNLPYVNSIVRPNYYFDAQNIESIEVAILSAIYSINKLPSDIIIKNKIKNFIKHILD